MTDTPSTDVTAIHAEVPEKLHSNNYRSVIPTDIQALTVLQDLVSDDFQAKNTPSTQRKGEDTRSIQRKGEDETFQLIQKIHNQLQEVQWDLQRLHSLHKYKKLILQTPGKYPNRFPILQIRINILNPLIH